MYIWRELRVVQVLDFRLHGRVLVVLFLLYVPITRSRGGFLIYMIVRAPTYGLIHTAFTIRKN